MESKTTKAEQRLIDKEEKQAFKEREILKRKLKDIEYRISILKSIKPDKNKDFKDVDYVDYLKKYNSKFYKVSQGVIEELGALTFENGHSEPLDVLKTRAYFLLEI